MGKIASCYDPFPNKIPFEDKNVYKFSEFSILPLSLWSVVIQLSWTYELTVQLTIYCLASLPLKLNMNVAYYIYLIKDSYLLNSC